MQCHKTSEGHAEANWSHIRISVSLFTSLVVLMDNVVCRSWWRECRLLRMAVVVAEWAGVISRPARAGARGLGGGRAKNRSCSHRRRASRREQVLAPTAAKPGAPRINRLYSNLSLNIGVTSRRRSSLRTWPPQGICKCCLLLWVSSVISKCVCQVQMSAAASAWFNCYSWIGKTSANKWVIL